MMSAPDFSQVVIGLIGQVVLAGGGGALVAFLLFKFLGKSWLQHELAKDLETAKSEIALVLSRRMKLHDQEYIVFPEIWAKLGKAYASLGNAVVSFRSIPNFKIYSHEEFSEWLVRNDFTEDEQRFLVAATDKSAAYCKILDFRDLSKAHTDFVDFSNYFKANRIFLQNDIKRKLDEVRDLMWSAWVDRKMDLDGHSIGSEKSFLVSAYETYEKKANPVINEIEESFQLKLFPPEIKKNKEKAT